MSPSAQPHPLKGVVGAEGWTLRVLALSKQGTARFLSTLEINLSVILSRDRDDTYDI